MQDISLVKEELAFKLDRPNISIQICMKISESINLNNYLICGQKCEVGLRVCDHIALAGAVVF